MDYTRYSIKVLIGMEYINNEPNNISIYDLMMFYKNNNGYKTPIEGLFNINILNIDGILAFLTDKLEVHFKTRNSDGLINICIDDENIVSNLFTDEKLLNMTLSGRENVLLKKLYICIDDCPTDIKEDLFLYRQRSLFEEAKAEKNKSIDNKIKLIRKRKKERMKLL